MRKIALIGYGYWGRILLPYLEECFDVAYICHRTAEESGIFTPSLSKVLNSNLDAVVIATPIDTHYDIARRSLEAGKHVFCEKPLAMSYGDAIHLTDLSLVNKLCLFTDYTYMYSLGIKKAKDIIDSGEMGEVLFIDMSFQQYGRFNSFNVYWLLASHLLAIMDKFLRLNGCTFKLMDIIRDETGVIIVFGGQSVYVKPIGYINVSIRQSVKKRRISWHCTKGRIDYNGIGNSTLTIEKYSKPDSAFEIYYPTESHCLRYIVQSFSNVLDCKEDSTDNLRVSLAVTKILEGLEVGR